MTMDLGMVAPDFTLYNTEKEKITLSALRGQTVLLLFFPLAFTSVCTQELCLVRDQLSWYEKLEAAVMGISVDSLYSLAKYKAEQRLNFPLLSDFNREVSLLYGCLYEQFSYGMKGVSKRSAFVIDPQGILQHIEILENAGELPNFSAIEKRVEALKVVK